MFAILIRFSIILAALLTVSTARADWLNLSGAETAPNIAEIYVKDDHVRLVLEIHLNDLVHFEELVPEDWLSENGAHVPTLSQRMIRFSGRGFQFVTETDSKLQAQLIRAEPRLRIDRKSPFAGMINPITRRPVPEAPADKRVLYVELKYPFNEKPKRLTIVPPQDDNGQVKANMGFITYHKAVPVIDFRYLGAPEKLSLDWEDPWYSRFANPNLKRHHKSALMSFLYVEPYEVRHEILTRVKDLGSWMDLGLRGNEFIEVDELEPLRRRIGEFMLGKNPVLIDGEAHKPILDRTNYVKAAMTGIKILEKPERMEIATALVGVIITYITNGIPGEVKVNWELFTDQVNRVPATATDPVGPLPTYLTPDDNVHTWTNFLKNYRLPAVQKISVADSLGDIRIPLISSFCGILAMPLIVWIILRKIRGQSVKSPNALLGVILITGMIAFPVRITIARPEAVAGALRPDQARELLQVLLKNVYRAFDFRDEEDVYDKLAISVNGDLLADIYLQNRHAFSIQQAGGAQARIQSVEVHEAKAEYLGGRPLTYAIKGIWSAQGSISHWGHVHSRRNRYEAVVTVEAVDGLWKITDFELLEEQRVTPSFDLKSGMSS